MKPIRVLVLIAAMFGGLAQRPAPPADVPLRISAHMDPPRWATLERQLLAENVPACREFFKKYFDDRGYLQCFVRWGANDGPDDAFENFNRWPELHALGAGDEILADVLQGPRGADQAVHRGQDDRRADRPAGHVLQGIHRPVRLDAPRRRAAALQPHGPVGPGRCRSIRSARGGSPGSTWARIPKRPTTTRVHKIIRSMQNGSRGPMLRKATALDWVGDPFDVKGFDALHGESTFEQFLAHYQEYGDVVGDHFLNLVATTLPTNAYLLAGEPKYKTWLVEYMDAWLDRMKQNGGIIPSFVDLDGTDRRARGQVVEERLRLGIQPGQSGDRPPRRPQSDSARAGRLQQRAARHRRSEVRRCLAHDDRRGELARARGRRPQAVSDDARRRRLVWLARRAVERRRAGSLVLVAEAAGSSSGSAGNGWVGFLQGQNPAYPEQALRTRSRR